MSKIYEALIRAQSERQTGGSPLPSDDAVRTRILQQGAAEAGALPSLDGSDPAGVFASDTFAPDTFDTDALDTENGPALDLSAIPRRKWTPLLDRLPSLQDRGGPVEQFRNLRSRLYEDRGEHPLKSLLISSGLPQEGKSFIAANLATMLCRHENARVLLIDGDMRRNTLHQLFGCAASPGLADFLSGDSSLLEIMQRPDVLQQLESKAAAALTSLTFIPGGNGGDRAADLSGNGKFQELIRAAAPLFDWIIVDSSPVTLVTDAVNLARACDAVLLVVRGGVTKYEVAQRAQAEFRASRIVGVVLNAVEDMPQSYGYYGYDAEASSAPPD